MRRLPRRVLRVGVPAPVHDRDLRFFLAAWFLYPLIEANFEMFGVETHGGFVFGVIVAMVLARAGRIAPQGGTAVLRRPD
jgi:membrane associated rhomboid family serine protease